MRKIICPYTNKGIWVTRALLDQIRTMDLLKVPIIVEMPPVDIHHYGSSYITIDNKQVHAHYFDNNQWGFIVTEAWSFTTKTGPKPDWLSHPLFPDWANGQGIAL